MSRNCIVFHIMTEKNWSKPIPNNATGLITQHLPTSAEIKVPENCIFWINTVPKVGTNFILPQTIKCANVLWSNLYDEYNISCLPVINVLEINMQFTNIKLNELQIPKSVNKIVIYNYYLTEKYNPPNHVHQIEYINCSNYCTDENIDVFEGSTRRMNYMDIPLPQMSKFFAGKPYDVQQLKTEKDKKQHFILLRNYTYKDMKHENVILPNELKTLVIIQTDPNAIDLSLFKIPLTLEKLIIIGKYINTQHLPYGCNACIFNEIYKKDTDVPQYCLDIIHNHNISILSNSISNMLTYSSDYTYEVTINNDNVICKNTIL